MNNTPDAWVLCTADGKKFINGAFVFVKNVLDIIENEPDPDALFKSSDNAEQYLNSFKIEQDPRFNVAAVLDLFKPMPVWFVDGALKLVLESGERVFDCTPEAQ
jgi:hypothetical protein